MNKHNIFHPLPERTDIETFEDILRTPNIRVERIVSHGQSSPEEGWYDQDEAEWVVLLQGSAVLGFENGKKISLQAGGIMCIFRRIAGIGIKRKQQFGWRCFI